MKLKGIFKNTPAWKKLLLLVWFVCISFLITYFISIVTAYIFWGSSVFNTAFLTDLSNPESIGVMKYIQAFNSVGMFLIPSLLLSWLTYSDSGSFHITGVKCRRIKYFIVAILALSMLPVSNFLAELNQMISFPDSLSSIESFLRNAEKESERLTHSFIFADNIPVLLLNIFIIAVIPAVAEEFFFRGALQKTFAQMFKNVHTAIFVTALIFSIIHFQFFSFVPRLFLGMVLGYLMHYTGNIWIPIVAHFVNNAAAVIVYYFVTIKAVSPESEHIGDSASIVWFIAGIIIAVSAFYMTCSRKKFKAQEL